MLRASLLAVCAGAFVLQGCPSATTPDGSTNDGSMMDAGDAACGTPRMVCSGRCIDTSSDPMNCGACGNACHSGMICMAGMCKQPFPAPETNCGAFCVNPNTDNMNCGACGTVCPSGQVCSAGHCAVNCAPGLMSCGGADGGTDGGTARTCVDTNNDRSNCGVCGRACAPGHVCQGGGCLLTCPMGQMACGDRCSDPMTDVLHCGGCPGAACLAGQNCMGGTCTMTCATGQTNCTGICTNLQTDPAACGMCGHACATGQVCNAGRCDVTCSPGQSNCTGSCVDEMTDPANCGSCGHACPAGQVCTAGACMSQCVTGQVVCGGRCTSTTTDRNNCGACGTVCPSGAICSGGSCQTFCGTGQTMCGSTCVNTMVDPANCGTCAHACPSGQVCNAGACSMVAMVDGGCAAPSTMCGALCVDTRSDNMHCGGCGTICSASTTCVSGACVTPCTAGQVRCGGTCTTTSTDAMNCGACGHACPTGMVCLGGSCSSIITGYHTGPLPASVVWVDACAAPGALMTLGGIDDGMGMTYTMPFTFTFFENMYTQVTPSADGYLGFGATGTDFGSYGAFQLSPPTAFMPEPAFFVYSRDLYQRAAGTCFTTIGTAPNRSVVWETNDAYNYFDATTDLTFEVFLNEGSNTIDVIYQTLTGPSTDGSSSSVGMVNATGTHSFQYEYLMGGTLMSGLRLRFFPN